MGGGGDGSSRTEQKITRQRKENRNRNVRELRKIADADTEQGQKEQRTKKLVETEQEKKIMVVFHLLLIHQVNVPHPGFELIRSNDYKMTCPEIFDFRFFP